MNLAQNIPTIIGQITPVGPFAGDPLVNLGKLLAMLVQIVLLVATIIAGLYMILGAFDYITSGGDKEKVAKAQNKITNAAIGLILVVCALVIFGVVGGDILGIIKKTDSGWQFNIPTLGP